MRTTPSAAVEGYGSGEQSFSPVHLSGNLRLRMFSDVEDAKNGVRLGTGKKHSPLTLLVGDARRERSYCTKLIPTVG